MKDNGCFTCKERKIACDRTRPICWNCNRSKRTCQPYYKRLSWPSVGGRKRAVLGYAPSRFRSQRKYTQFEFINTYVRDIEIYRCLADPEFKLPLAQYVGTYILAPTVPLPTHPRFEGDEPELIRYFFSVVLPSLPTFGIDLESLRSVVTRLAFLDDTASSQAVLNSLLALAAVYMSGSPRKAAKFIATALKSLRASATTGLGILEGMQHILAGMLLCSFEIHMFSQSSSVWLLYLFNIKAVANHFYEHELPENKDLSLLSQWIFYYDTFARLGIKHWRGHRSLQSQLAKEVDFDEGESTFINVEITRLGKSSHMALKILSELCEGVLPPDNPQYRSTVYITWLNQVESQLSSIRQEMQHNAALHDLGSQSESVAVKELFVLATLVYMEKKSKQLVGLSSKTDEWIKDAFLILSRIEHCNKPFPLFIFGFDARTDCRRLIILELMDRTIKKANTGGLVLLRDLLVKFWKQDDLNTGGNIDFESNSCFFLSNCNFVPCLL